MTPILILQKWRIDNWQLLQSTFSCRLSENLRRTQHLTLDKHQQRIWNKWCWQNLFRKINSQARRRSKYFQIFYRQKEFIDEMFDVEILLATQMNYENQRHFMEMTSLLTFQLKTLRSQRKEKLHVQLRELKVTQNQFDEKSMRFLQSLFLQLDLDKKTLLQA